MAALLLGTAIVAPACARHAAAAPPMPAPFAAYAQRLWAASHRSAGVIAAPTASLARAQQSIADLRRTAAAIALARQAQQAAQSTARAFATPPPVPDGIAPGGLLPGGPWLGAAAPVQQAGTVTIHQTRKRAILNWQSLNVGRGTTLAFDQSAGGAAANTWVALNRVSDASGAPSQILGGIVAPGQVYLINQNGILFGPTSQVSTGALIASAAALSDSQFLAHGIYSPSATIASFTGAAARVSVAPGASITTLPQASPASGGGFVMLLGGSVDNNGVIATPGGQALLAAGQNFVLRPGAGTSSGADPAATVQGTQVAVLGGGAAVNAGLLEAIDGDVTLVGRTVTQAGVIHASTGLGQRGTVHLLTSTNDPRGSVTLAPGSTIAVTIDDDATTAIEAQRDTAARPSTTQLADAAGLPDVGDRSRVEITSGGSIGFGAGSLTLASNGQVAVAARRGVSVAGGATIDVSGLLDVPLPAAAHSFAVSIEPYNLRDSPNNRDTGALSNQTALVDARGLAFVPASSADPSARFYTAGGLLEVSGELGNVGHTIAEYATSGGSIVLSAGSVAVQPGAVVDLAGGSLRYSAGVVPQTWLVGVDGRLYNLASATDGVAYLGLYTGVSERHVRWGVTETFRNPLVAPAGIVEPAYSVGEPAGTLGLSAPSIGFDGTLIGDAFAGPRQNAPSAGGRAGLLATQSVVPQAGTLVVAAQLATATTLLDADVTIGPSGAAPGARGVALSAGAIGRSGIGSLQVRSTGTITVTGALTLAAGGAVTLEAPVVGIGAPVIARGGQVTLGFASSDTADLSPRVHAQGVTLDGSATIDTRGVWSNLSLGPAEDAGAAFVDGGAVTLKSLGSVGLAPGSLIDASAGASLAPNGALTGGTGGDIALLADIMVVGTTLDVNPGPSARRALTLGGTLRGYGVSQGGVLTLQAPGFAIGDGSTPSYAGEVVLPPSLFATGFRRYDLIAATDARVAPGARVDVSEPVLQESVASPAAPSGSDPAGALQLVLPPLFSSDARRTRLTQRAGAGFTLEAPGQVPVASTDPSLAPVFAPATPYGRITLGAGAAIAVDPGQGVRLDASLAATVEGTISAPGGIVEVLVADRSSGGNPLLGNAAVWIGSGARLDVSGIAATALDAAGHPFGTVTPGGSIVLGNVGGADGLLRSATDAFVVVRPGATLDAAGAEATLTIPAVTARLVAAAVVDDATSGGTIRLASNTGIFDDGTLLAPGGGMGAAGGTLDVVLETGLYATTIGGTRPNPRLDPYLHPRTLVVAQAATATLPADVTPASLRPVVGTATLSADAISAGGFGTVSLFARDGIVFDGDVALRAAQAITLDAGALAHAPGATHALVAAPYVLLAGDTVEPQAATAPPYTGTLWNRAAVGSLTIAADLIDLRDTVDIGTAGALTIPTGAGALRPVSLPGFATTVLSSTGDIRFLVNDGYTVTLDPHGTYSTLDPPTLLTSLGNVSLVAARVYPVTDAVGVITLGTDGLHARNPGATLTIGRAPGGDTGVPLSAFGRLALNAPTVDQGGVVRAPFGSVSIGAAATIEPATVRFLPGSVTSVSAAGASIPYGGSVDGVSYTYAGTPVAFAYGTRTAAGLGYGISVLGQSVVIEQGATLDLSGGGTLAGAGFISGRGGSTDALYTPLLTVGLATHTVSAPSLGAADQVFAVLPNWADAYAPSALLDQRAGYAGSVPSPGETVTIGTGVPGLPPGSYTLLPSYYALQPGAYRIELRAAAPPLPSGALALPNGSFLAAVATGSAPTGVQSALPITAIVTPGAVLRRYSQYDEESYADFARGQPSVAVFGNPVPLLPSDAAELSFAFGPRQRGAPALVDDGTVLFDPAAGGAGGTLSVTPATTGDALVIGAATPRGGATALVDAAALDAIHPANLVLGGYELEDRASGGGSVAASVTPVAGDLTIASGATLQAEQIVVLGYHRIDIRPGVSLRAIAGAAPLRDVATGEPLGVGSLTASGVPSVLALSDDGLRFAPISAAIGHPLPGGGIVVGAGATLQAADTLAFATTQRLALADGAVLEAGAVALDATEVVVGATPSGVSIPAGAVRLAPALLDQLLDGDPGLREFDLTATRAIDLLGPATLGAATLGTLVLSTPAILGLGAPGDVATIAARTLYWTGLSTDSGTADANGAPILLPVAPPLASAGGPGTGIGGLRIETSTLVLGGAPFQRPVDTIELPRMIAGFAAVDIVAATRVVGADWGSLTIVEAQAPAFSNGAPVGTIGGTLGGTGGQVSITTPLLTGGPAGRLDLIVGGTLSLVGAGGASTSAGLGATVNLDAASIVDSTAIEAPEGRVVLAGTAGVTLLAGATIDVSGAAVPILDQVPAGPGGTVLLHAAQGTVIAAPGSLIAFAGAGDQAGGTLDVLAPAAPVVLAGRLAGARGSVAIDAGQLAQGAFDALNQALDGAGVDAARTFTLRSGDLAITDATGLAAHVVGVTLDAGSLLVAGTVDASGPRVGGISLAAQYGLRLTGAALLDARATGLLVTDSYGAAIDASNRAAISLGVAAGTLQLDPGARLDLRAADALARGDLELDAPRVGTGDVAIVAAGPLAILGAATVALNGFASYHPSDGLVTQATLDAIDADSRRFVDAALVDAGLGARLAGLSGAAFHLRPGVVIDAAAAPSGDLRVVGDLDLAAYRYCATANCAVASEPGTLVLRAAGDLFVNGSISDGFAAAPASPDQNGWVTRLGRVGNGYATTVLVPVSLGAGSTFRADDVALGYALPLAGGAEVRAGAAVPVAVRLTARATFAEAWVARSAVTLADGTTIAAGAIIPAGTTLPAGTIVAAGGVLPMQVRIGAVTWPAGASLAPLNVGGPSPSTLVTAAAVTLRLGDVIPGDATVAGERFGPAYAPTRPSGAGGAQGAIDALAPMLPPGSLSWSLALVAGGDLGSASALGVAPGGTGDLVLDDLHYGSPAQYGFRPGPVGFSVLRTGTGALTLAAAGSIEQDSPYGIYTAGTQTASLAPAYTPVSLQSSNQPRAYAAVTASQLAAGYQPYYPTDGGDLRVLAGADLVISGGGIGGATATSPTGAWLWQQGDATRPGAWWVDFGGYTNAARPQLAGFTGFGTLGGGNLDIVVGGAAGAVTLGGQHGDAISVAVASTGRVVDGTLVQSGGGDLAIAVQGAINPAPVAAGPPSVVVDLRGQIAITAGAVGEVVPEYGTIPEDPRALADPLVAEGADITGGVLLGLGDAAASVVARGDVALADAFDPGRVGRNLLLAPDAAARAVAIEHSGFSLWRPDTSIALLSAGGDVAPSDDADATADTYAHLYPPRLAVTAQDGSVYFGRSSQPVPIELAPSPDGALSILASGSVYGYTQNTGAQLLNATIGLSGAPVGDGALPTPFHPAYTGAGENISNPFLGGRGAANELFAFESDTPDGPIAPFGAATGAASALVLAATGDIVDLTVGAVVAVGTGGRVPIGATWYSGSIPVRMQAGRDIVAVGQPAPGLFVNDTSADVSLLRAGRDIVYANLDVAGPGLLLVEAGRDLYQARYFAPGAGLAPSDSVLSSLGVRVVAADTPASDRAAGAAITVLAGAGDAGPSWRAFADLYLDDANRADPALLTTDPGNLGKVQATYGVALLDWLRANTGYAGDDAGALAAFERLPVERQTGFLLQVLFDELRASGRQFDDPASRFAGSYARGRDAIAALFPGAYAGGITLTGESGIQTQFGGAISVLAPGGSVVLGEASQAASGGAGTVNTAGLVTYGQGDIDVYALGSVLLGQSRVFTTFGGGITIWSARGDINAGRGAKSTVVAQPFQLSYDAYGDVALSPTPPATGAGIATLAEIPGTAPGDVDLIAPGGTIDAGEAGIRASGNANLAALAVANVANIQAKGGTKGVPVVAAPNLSAITAASALAGAQLNAAQTAGTPARRRLSDSIITVEVLGFGP